MAKAKRSTHDNRRMVETLVREAIGTKHAKKISRRDINRLVREFVTAGRGAVRLETATAAQAAHIMNQAHAMVSRARKRLAEVTRPGDRDIQVDRKWRTVLSAMETHGDRLMAYPGVVGLRPGYRSKG